MNKINVLTLVIVLVAIIGYGSYLYVDSPNNQFVEVPNEITAEMAEAISSYNLEVPVYNSPNTEYTYYGFEANGFQGWVDGGSDASLSSSFSKKNDNDNDGGSRSVQLRDDSSTSYISNNFDFTALNNVTISFWAYYNSIEGTESLRVLCDGNEVYRFNGNGFENYWRQDNVIIGQSDCTFDDSVEIRFQAFFGSNYDRVYIDGIDMNGDHPDPVSPVISLVQTDRTDYDFNQRVIVNVTIDDISTISGKNLTLIYPSGNKKVHELNHLSGSHYYVDLGYMMEKGQYEFYLNLTDLYNNTKNSASNTVFNRIVNNEYGFDMASENGTIPAMVINVTNNNSNVLDLSIQMNNSKGFNKLDIVGLDLNQPGVMLRLNQETPDEGVDGMTDTFAIDPSALNLSYINITFQATNSAMVKCTDYNFDTQTCGDDGYFVIKKDMIPGVFYTITIDAKDPAFGQQITGADNITDGRLQQNSPDRAWGAATVTRVGQNAGGNERRIIVNFSLDFIPEGAVVENAEVSLYYSNDYNGGDLNTTIHKVTDGWRQGGTANPNDAANNGTTWNSRWFAENWAIAGGDINDTWENWSIIVDTTVGSRTTWNVTNDVKGMVLGQFPRYGWIIKTTDAGGGNIQKGFSTSETGTPSQQPILIVNWTTIGVAPTVNTTYFNGANTTNFASELNYFNVTNATFQRTGASSVRFIGEKNVSTINFDGNIILDQYNITVYDENLPAEFNQTSELIFYGTGFKQIPFIYRDGVLCTECNNPSVDDAGNVKFTVPTFSSYVIVGNTSLAINDSNKTTEVFTTEVVNFTANYSEGGVPISGASCVISFNDTINASMIPFSETSLVNYWNFDEGSGTTFASQVTGTNGDFGGTMASNQWTAGVVGNAAFTDGGNSGSGAAAEWLDTNYGFAFSQQDSFALCMWMATTDTTTGTDANDLGAQTGANRLGNQRTGGNWGWIMSQGGNAEASSTLTTDGSWNQYCLVRDVPTDTFQAWYNGVNQNNGTDVTTGDLNLNTADLFFGARNLVDTGGARDSVDISVDEVSFWNRSLNAAEVSFLYNGGSGRSYTETLSLDPGSDFYYNRTFSDPNTYEYNVSCSATNYAGLFASSELTIFINDTTGPTLNTTFPINGSFEADGNLNITINITDNESKLFNATGGVFYDNGTNILNQSFDWSAENLFTTIIGIPIVLADGIYNIFFNATDLLGNIGELASTFTVDTTTPEVFVQSPYPNGTYLNNEIVNVQFNASGTNIDTLWYNNGTDNITGIANSSVNLSDGVYTYQFYANNSAGTEGNNQTTFTVDTTPPFIEIVSPVNGSTSTNETVLVNITTSDITTNVTTVIFNDGVSNITYTGPVLHNFSEGVNIIQAWATDFVGNTNTTQNTFTVPTNYTIDSCRNITQPGVYTVTDYLSGGDVCVNITSSNVEIQCNFVPFAAENIAVLVQNITPSLMSNITISNCIINNGTIGKTALHVDADVNPLSLENNIMFIGDPTGTAVLNLSSQPSSGFSGFNNTLINNASSSSYGIFRYGSNTLGTHVLVSTNITDYVEGNWLGGGTVIHVNLTLKNDFGSTYFNGSTLIIDPSTTGEYSSTNINISQSQIFINSTNLTVMNASALVELNNIGFTGGQVSVDFDDSGSFAACDPSLCSQIDTSTTTAKFYTEHFTTFSILSSTLPNITLIEPLSNYSTLTDGQSLNLNWSIESNNTLDICWYEYNPQNVDSNCFQESFNVSNQTGNDGDCSINYNGTYTQPAGGNISTIDGDYNTKSLLFSASPGTYFTATYYLPNANVTAVNWRMKAEDNGGTVFDDTFTLPASCFSNGSVEFNLRRDPTTNPYFVSCLQSNGTSHTLRNYPTSGSANFNIYEESINWTTETQSIFNVSCELNHTTFNYVDGVNNITFFARDILGNTGNATKSWVILANDTNVSFTSPLFVSQIGTYNFQFTSPGSVFKTPLLVYNGATQTADLINNGDGTYNISTTRPAFETEVGTNNKFSFRVTIDGVEFDSGNFTNSVEDISMNICDQFNTSNMIHVNFQDESNLSALNASVPTSTFKFFLEDESAAKTFTYTQASELDQYNFCFTPSNLTYKVDIDFPYASTGYPQRVFRADNLTVTNSTTNRTLYLLSASSGFYSRYSTVDSKTGQPLKNVEVVAQKLVNGTTVTVAQGLTDDAALISLWLNPNDLHTFTFTLAGYNINTFSIRPDSPDVYQIAMIPDDSGEVANGSQILNNLTYTIGPTNITLTPNTTYTFYFNVSRVPDIDNMFMNITAINTSGSEVTLFTGSRSGSGSLSAVLNTLNYTTIRGSYQIDVGTEVISTTKTWQSLNLTVGDFSLKGWMNYGNSLSMTSLWWSIFRYFAIMIILLTIAYQFYYVDPFDSSFASLVAAIVVVWMFGSFGWLSVPTPGGVADDYVISGLFTTIVVAFILWRYKSQ